LIQKKSVALLSVINLASALMGIGSSVVMAQAYGVSPDVEVYFAATSLFFMITSLTQTGQLSEITLPIYHRFKENVSQLAANAVFSVILSWMGIVAISISLLAFLFSGPLYEALVPGFDDSKLALGTVLFAIISPLICLEIIKSLLVTLMNAEKVFARIELITLANQGFAILSILLFHKQFGIYAALSGLLLGEFISFGMAIYFLRGTPFRYQFQLNAPGFDLKEVLGKMSFTFVYVLSTQFWSFGFNAALSFLPQGYFAVFKYATLIYSKLNGLVLRPVTVVFFTQFSTLLQQGSSKLKSLVQQANRLTFLLAIAAGAFMIASSKPLLNVLWRNGKFEAEYIDTTFFTLVLLIGLVFFNGLGLIFRKMCMSSDLVKTQYAYFIALQIGFGIFTYFFGQSLSYWLLALVFIMNNIGLALIPVAVIFFYRNDLFTLYQEGFLLKAITFAGLLLSAALAIHFGLGQVWNTTTMLQNIFSGAVSTMLIGTVLLLLLKFVQFEELKLLGFLAEKVKLKRGKSA
jgi:putative peptidoglycan lipid II flippase